MGAYTVEIGVELRVRSGIIGRQVENGKIYPGGGHQYELIDDISKNWEDYLSQIGVGVKLK